MTVAIIALFMSLAVCALIGWAFIRVLGVLARSLRRQSTPPARRASDPSIVFRDPTAQEVAEKDGFTDGPLPRGDVETYFEDGRWKNKVRGNSRASNVHETKGLAVRAGREMARKRRVEHIVKKKDGSIGERNIYGTTPQSVPPEASPFG